MQFARQYPRANPKLSTGVLRARAVPSQPYLSDFHDSLGRCITPHAQPTPKDSQYFRTVVRNHTDDGNSWRTAGDLSLLARAALQVIVRARTSSRRSELSHAFPRLKADILMTTGRRSCKRWYLCSAHFAVARPVPLHDRGRTMKMTVRP